MPEKLARSANTNFAFDHAANDVGNFAEQFCPRYLGHISLESYLSTGSRTLTDMLLGDEQGAIFAGFGWDIEQYSGLAFAHAGE